MKTTSLKRFGALNSAAKNPLADSIESIALGVAKIRSVTDNQLMRQSISMVDLDQDLVDINYLIRGWLDEMGVRV